MRSAIYILSLSLLSIVASCGGGSASPESNEKSMRTCIWKSSKGTITMCETRDDMTSEMCASNIGQVHSFGGTPAATELASECPSEGSIGSCKPYKTEYVLFDQRDYTIICGSAP